MKKLLFILSAAVLLYSCSCTPERGNYIPKSAKAVVTINMKGIVDEIKWDILFGGDLFKFKTPSNDPFVKQLVEDPTKTGVEFMERTYLFVDSTVGIQPIVVGIIPLNDADAFAEFLSTKGDTVVTEGDFQAANSLKARLVWNSKTAFYVSGKNDIKEAVAYVSALIENEKSGLLSTNFKGKTVLTAEDHIAFWVNSGDIQKGMLANPLMAQAPAMKPEKSEFTGVVNFKNGKLAITCDQYFDEKSSLLKVFQKESKLKELAAAADMNKSFVSLGFSANMKALAEYMGTAGLKELVDMMLASSGVTTDTAAAMLDGDVFVSFDGIQIKMEEKEKWDMNEASGEYEMTTEMGPGYYPTIVAGLSLADTAMAKQYVNRLLYNFSAINKEGIYAIEGGKKGYVFFKEKNMFYVSDTASIVAIKSGKAIASNDILNDFAAGMVINLKDVSKKLPLAALSPDAEKIAKKIEASIEGIKAVNKPVKSNVAHSEIELNAVNKEQNILITILKLIKELDTTPGV
ncbi:MAG: DUF4836 family protein [Bacteroidetes bacterium]|nr:DUF4836 family protein [Bacteroidota bacterium]